MVFSCCVNAFKFFMFSICGSSAEENSILKVLTWMRNCLAPLGSCGGPASHFFSSFLRSHNIFFICSLSCGSDFWQRKHTHAHAHNFVHNTFSIFHTMHIECENICSKKWIWIGISSKTFRKTFTLIWSTRCWDSLTARLLIVAFSSCKRQL